MRVGAYVRGKASQNEGATSQGNEQTTAIRPSRQRVAEMARVTVPVTRLSVMPQPQMDRNAQNEPVRQSPSQDQVPQLHRYDTEIPLGRDMFDTDVEGIDDSTTTTSFVGGESSQAQHQILPFNEQRFSQNSGPSSNHDHVRNDTSGHKSLAERLMSELGSDPEDDYNQENHRDPQDDGDQAEDEQEENGDEDTQLFDWESNKATNGEPLTWQRIEATLREGRSQPPENPSVNPGFPQSSQEHEAAEANNPYNNRFEQGEVNGFPSLKALPRIPPNSRFSQRSRFTTPNVPPSAPNGNNLAETRPVLRPASALGAPISPESTTKPKFRIEDEAEKYDDVQIPNQDDQYNQAGVFDTTDLSALDSSDSNDNQPTYTSLRLSTLSPVSTKRDHTAFTADYPSNILQSKSYSDLKAESFDYNPAPPRPIFPPQEPPLPLSEKLNRLKTLTDDQREAFFSSLTINQWEESGDWLLEQFGNLLKKAKDARHKRREVASVFENEIEKRYEAVEEEGKSINKRLEEMRTGGMGVLKGTQ